MAAALEEKVAALEQTLEEREQRAAELEQAATVVEAELAASRALAARREQELELLRTAAGASGETLPDQESPYDASPTPPEVVSTALARVEAAQLSVREASAVGRARSVLLRAWLTHPYRAFATAVGLGVCVAMLVSALLFFPDSQPPPSTLALTASPPASQSVADSSAVPEPQPTGATEPALVVDDARPDESSADDEPVAPASGKPIPTPSAVARHEKPPVPSTSPEAPGSKGEPASAGKTAARTPGQKAKAGRSKAPKRRATTVKPSNKSLDDLFDDVF